MDAYRMRTGLDPFISAGSMMSWMQCQRTRDVLYLTICTVLLVRLCMEMMTSPVPVSMQGIGADISAKNLTINPSIHREQYSETKEAKWMLGCTHTAEIERALRNPSFQADGAKQEAFGIQLFNNSFVLKRPRNVALTSTMLEELRKLTTFPGPGLAKVFGFCTDKERTPWLLLETSNPFRLPFRERAWMLLEKAAPLQLPFQERPSCSQLFSLTLPLVYHFIMYPELAITKTMTGTMQFAVTDDRVILVDLENVGIGDSGLLDRPGQYQARNHCSVPTDCTNSRERLFWRGTVACQFSCWKNRCIRWSNSQHNLCKLRSTLFASLAKHYVQLRPLYEASSDTNFRKSLLAQGYNLTSPVRMDLKTFYDLAVNEKSRQCGAPK